MWFSVRRPTSLYHHTYTVGLYKERMGRFIACSCKGRACLTLVAGFSTMSSSGSRSLLEPLLVQLLRRTCGIAARCYPNTVITVVITKLREPLPWKVHDRTERFSNGLASENKVILTTRIEALESLRGLWSLEMVLGTGILPL